MKVFGFSVHQFVMIGLAASIFILLAKWLGAKSGIPAIANTTGKI